MRASGGTNTKLHAVAGSLGRLIHSSCPRVRSAITRVPRLWWAVCHRLIGCWEIEAMTPTCSRKPLMTGELGPAFQCDNRATNPVRYDKRRYKRRNRIEIMFGHLKDWRRIATRYVRCLKVFLSVIALAAAILFWL